MHIRASSGTVLAVLFFTVLFDQGGLLLIVPMMPALLQELTGLDLAKNAFIGGWLLTVYALMQFLFAPIVGSLSDRFGRRMVLLFSSFIFIIDYIIMSLAPHIAVLFVGRILSGIAGATVVTALASTADISNDDTRTKNFALMYAAIGMGAVVGPMITALVAHLGVRAPFWLAAGIALINFLLIYFLFPETLSKDNRRPWKFTNPFSSLLNIGRYPGLKTMFSSQFILVLAFQAPLTLWAYYGKSRFNWSEQEIAYSLMALGLIMIFTQSVLVRVAYPLLGNKRICILGFVLFIIGVALIGMAQTTLMLYIALLFYATASISNSAFTAIYSTQVDGSEQGELQGVIVSLVSLASMIGPIIMSKLYDYGIEKQLIFTDGLPFLVASLMSVASLILLIIAFRHIPDPPVQEDQL